MKAKKLETIISEFKDPVIVALNYDLKKLTIHYEANENEDFTLTFESPAGFRCLDERDLMDYWEHQVFTQNWMLEVFEGGWLEMEKTRGMLSHQVHELREFLVVGMDECITVLATSEPLIEKKK